MEGFVDNAVSTLHFDTLVAAKIIPNDKCLIVKIEYSNW